MGEANARELSGDDIIHMEVGQPASPAPKAARERARQALENQRLGYTEALGLPKLRERIARHMSERYGVGVRPERVVVTAGSSADSFRAVGKRNPSRCRRIQTPIKSQVWQRRGSMG